MNTCISSLASSLLLGSVLVGCIDTRNDPPRLAHDDSALVGNGWTVWSWGTTQDETGISIGSSSDFTCFLAGVAGNLNDGCQSGFCVGSLDVPATALVWRPFLNLDHYQLAAHGGAYEDPNVSQRDWSNTPVVAQATCVFTTTNRMEGRIKIQFASDSRLLKLADLSAGNNTVRQCFLSGFEGSGGSWSDPTRTHAYVYPVTVVDSLHPTTGWYMEFDLHQSLFNDSPNYAYATCVDFPENTTITSDFAPGGWDSPITSGGGIKACGITGVWGAFNQNSWTDGVLMSFPAQIDGNWSLKVSASKAATWACAR